LQVGRILLVLTSCLILLSGCESKEDKKLHENMALVDKMTQENIESESELSDLEIPSTEISTEFEEVSSDLGDSSNESIDTSSSQGIEYTVSTQLTSDNFRTIFINLATATSNPDKEPLSGYPITEELFNRYVSGEKVFSQAGELTSINVDLDGFSESGEYFAQVSVSDNSKQYKYIVYINIDDDSLISSIETDMVYIN